MKFRYDPKNEEIVVSESTRVEYHQMNIWLTRHVKGYKYMPAFKLGVWNGKNTYFRNGKINLGLWKECFLGCKEIGTNFIIENKEDFPINRDVTLEKVKDFCKEYFKYHQVKKDGNMVPFMPYDHQIESAYKIIKNRYCMAEVATSGGKSLIISIVIFYTLKHIKPDAKFLLIAPSITLVTQFYDNMIEYNFGVNNIDKESIRDKKTEDYNPCELRIEEIMSDRPRKYSGTENPNIYIGTYQSLDKWPKKFFEQFHTVITDECLHPDSIINMGDGSKRKISDIKEGDFVKTINELTGDIEEKKVDYVYKNLTNTDEIFEIIMENDQKLLITGNHKVRLKDGFWKRVDELSEEDDILDFNFNI